MQALNRFFTTLCLLIACSLTGHMAFAESEMNETLDSETLSCLETNDCGAMSEGFEDLGEGASVDSDLSIHDHAGGNHHHATEVSHLFDNLWSVYPNGLSEEVKAEIGGQTNAAWVVNTCTIRISHSLNLSGSKVHAIAGTSSLRGANHQEYIYRVNDMIRYLSAKYGAPTLKKHLKNFASSDAMKAEFLGHKGIIVFVVKFSNATGHVDLWNGAEVKHADYFDRATEVYLWE